MIFSNLKITYFAQFSENYDNKARVYKLLLDVICCKKPYKIFSSEPFSSRSCYEFTGDVFFNHSWLQV